MSKKEKKMKKEEALQKREEYRPMGLFVELEAALFDRGFPFGALRRPWRWEVPWGGELAPFQGQMPAVDVIDQDNEVLVRAEVPGVTKEDLDVSVAANSVTIRGHSKREEEEKKGEYFRRETSYGKFSRTVGLPAEVDTDNAKAKFKDGVLEVTLQKVEHAKQRGIEIESD